jgi:hypothetical protein
MVEMIGSIVTASNVQLKFIDDEGDEIIVTSDNCLKEAVSVSKKSGSEAVRLILTTERGKEASIINDKKILLVAGIAAMAFVVVLAFKPKK